MSGTKSTKPPASASYQWRGMGHITAAMAEAEPVNDRLFPPEEPWTHNPNSKKRSPTGTPSCAGRSRQANERSQSRH
jgi:hypothetical protein